MIMKRGGVWQYNFRFSLRNADGSVENYRIRQSARTVMWRTSTAERCDLAKSTL
jgi:hypothetical protein